MTLFPPAQAIRSARLLPLLAALAFLAVTARAGDSGRPAARATAAGPTPVYTLADCIALALKQNPDVAVATKNLEADRAAVTVAKSGLYPSLSSSGYYQHLDEDYSSLGGIDLNRPTNDYAVTTRLTQSLYSAGAVRNRVAAAVLNLRAESLNFLSSVDTVTLAVRVAFYQTLFAEQNIGVRQQAVDLLGTQLKDQRDRLAAGSVSQLNVNRAQVALANEEPSLEQARYESRASYVVLATLMGVTYPDDATEAPFRLRGSLDYRSARSSLEDCLRQAEQLRPEIQARKLDLEALTKLVTVEKSATRPQVGGFVGYDVYSETSTLADRDYFSGYIVGLQGTWQIFDGFATLGRVRAARARVGIGAATLVSARLQAQADVHTAYYQLQQAEATLAPQAENARLADETLQISLSNFNAGLATQLDILQARVDLTRARTNELGARLVCNQARARLDRAMGIGRPVLNGPVEADATVGPK